MQNYIEPKVKIANSKELKQFDVIATRLGLKGFAILGKKYSKPTKSASLQKIEHISRQDITEEQVNKVRNKLPTIRKSFELIGVNTTSAKVAQWVVKDNRVDILSVPISKAKEIITRPLANVAANNKTFIEIDISALIDGSKSKTSIVMRNISRQLNILIQEKTPFIFTLNVKNPIELRDKRSIIALGLLLGVPESIVKTNCQAFYSRIELNRKKLAKEFIAPGITLVKDDKIVKEEKEQEDEIEQFEHLEIPDSLQEHLILKKKLERQRYLLFEILAQEEGQIKSKEFLDYFWYVFAKLFGASGSSRAGIYLSYFNPEKSFGILRCNNYSLSSVRATLTIMSAIQEIRVIVHVLKVSGTIKNLNQISRKKQ